MIGGDRPRGSRLPTRRAFLATSLAFAATTPARAAIVGADLLPGAGDRTAEFRAGLAAAVAEKRPFVIAPGTYRIDPVELPDGAQIHGTAGLTTLVAGGEGTLVSGRTAKRLVLSGLAFDGQNRKVGPWGSILAFSDVADLRLLDCIVGRGSDLGVLLDRCGGRIEKCTIASIGSYGLLSRDGRALTIADNTVADCGDGGILVHRAEPGEDGSVVSGNRVERIHAKSGGSGQVGNGINVHRAHDVAILSNRVTDCAFSGIRVNGGSNVRIVANEVQRSGETALYVEFEFQGAVVANNIVDGAVNGISVVNSQQGGRLATISGNIVRNLKRSSGPDPDTPAFGIAVEADTAVTGNVVEGAPKFGMLIGWGEFLRNVTVIGNIVRDAEVGIAVSADDRAGATIIADNIFQATRQGAVVGYRWKTRATGDLTLPDAKVPTRLTIERNRVSP
jgi:uncharacterized secreted repeat protein (TIGR03808 family)